MRYYGWTSNGQWFTYAADDPGQDERFWFDVPAMRLTSYSGWNDASHTWVSWCKTFISPAPPSIPPEIDLEVRWVALMGQSTFPTLPGVSR